MPVSPLTAAAVLAGLGIYYYQRMERYRTVKYESSGTLPGTEKFNSKFAYTSAKDGNDFWGDYKVDLQGYRREGQLGLQRIDVPFGVANSIKPTYTTALLNP